MIGPVRESRGFLEVERSKFYSYLVPWPLFSDRLEELRRLHRKAHHFVTAYRYFDRGEFREGGSDDREPAGTGKRPILHLLDQRGIVEVGVVVVRYFGGVLLGRGGLARAYREAAQLAIESGEFRPLFPPVRKGVEILYRFTPQFEELLTRHRSELLQLVERRYSIFGVEYLLEGERGEVERFLNQIPPHWVSEGGGKER